MIIVGHIILQNVVSQDVIDVLLKALILRLIMIISINKEKDKEDIISTWTCLLIWFDFYVVGMYFYYSCVIVMILS